MNYYLTHYNLSYRHTYTSCRKTRPINLHNIQAKNLTFNALLTLKNSTILDRTWRTFNIPKASGGVRTITAPSEDLKDAQKTIIKLLQSDYKILESYWSFAYIKGVSTLNANKAHTDNRSKWFLKVDIKDFFNSISTALIRKTIETTYPTCTFNAIERRDLLDLIEYFCLYEGRTPQGGVSSPFLSNWVMIPFLYEIHKKINELAKNEDYPQIPKQKYVITCYADDIEISAKNQFNWMQIQNAIAEILQPYFSLKREKTKYTTNTGRNHMLGKVLNKDNNITMGYKKVQEWKHILLELCNEINGNQPARSLYDRQTLLGRLQWDFNTQQDYLNHILTKYEQKFTQNRSIIDYLKRNQ